MHFNTVVMLDIHVWNTELLFLSFNFISYLVQFSTEDYQFTGLAICTEWRKYLVVKFKNNWCIYTTLHTDSLVIGGIWCMIFCGAIDSIPIWPQEYTSIPTPLRACNYLPHNVYFNDAILYVHVLERCCMYMQKCYTSVHWCYMYCTVRDVTGAICTVKKQIFWDTREAFYEPCERTSQEKCQMTLGLWQ